MTWTRLGHTVLGGVSDNISVTFTPGKHLYIEYNIIASGQVDAFITFNNDTGTSYNYRLSANQAADSTGGAGTTNFPIQANIATARTLRGGMYILNLGSEEKTVIGHYILYTNGATNAPDRQEFVGKWINTSVQISEIEFTNADTGDYNTGSYLTVWGTD